MKKLYTGWKYMGLLHEELKLIHHELTKNIVIDKSEERTIYNTDITYPNS